MLRTPLIRRDSEPFHQNACRQNTQQFPPHGRSKTTSVLARGRHPTSGQSVSLEQFAHLWKFWRSTAPTTFTKNCDRLLDGDIARALFEDVVAQSRERQRLFMEHFS